MRGLVGYLRDRPIWVKLGLIMMVPTIATVAVGFGALLGNIDAASNADRARSLAGLSSDAGRLVHSLQDERAAATLLLSTSGQNGQKSAQTTYQNLAGRTELSSRDYAQHRAALVNLPTAFRDLLDRIDKEIGSLTAMRQQVNKTTDILLSTATARYNGLITDLISIRDSSAQLTGDPTLSYQMRAAAAISSAKEYLSEERIVVLQVLASRELTDENEKAFLSTITGQDQALQAFKVVATPDQQALLQQLISGPDLREAELYEGTFKSYPTGPLPVDVFGAGDWDNAMVGRANLMRQLEQRIDGQTVGDATRLRDGVQRQVLLEAGLLLSLVLIAVLIAWFVARSMNRSLRELRHGALAIAQYGLPQAVARLRDPALSTQQSPQQVAAQIAEPLPVRSRDEFGQVTEAFNAVHLEAVRTAAEQAALRSSVSTMFVNLARRSQILVDRLIGHLDRLERGEEDPDRLAELFQLDHLATRMRRNDENLLVLAGADSTRVQREPAALIDVLRAAQSEVEHYTRIEFGVIDRDIEIASHAVNDLVHLIAELFDNATAFSPPDSAVVVEARRLGDRATLHVEDHGIGISHDQLADLNERLATPPMVDVAVSRMMGLVVVARLATRHSVKVVLSPAAERGTVADVQLPTSVLVPRALTGRGPGVGAPMTREMPSGRPASPTAPPRSPFAAPLALESGSSGGRAPAGAGSGFGGPSMGGFGVGSSATNGATSGFGADPVNGGTGSGGVAPHPMPAWSDLTGVAGGGNGTSGANGIDVFTPRRPAGPQKPGDPLPQRRATEPRTVDGELTEQETRPAIPRQVSASPEARVAPPIEATPIEATPIVDADLVDERPSASPPVASPPPAWPPVAPYAAAAQPAAPETDEAAAPAVPEELAAALDITTEIPRVRGEHDGDPAGWGVREPQTDAPSVPAGYAPPLPVRPAEQRMGAPEPVRVMAYADETMELPIFRELESAWFRGREEDEAAPAAPAVAEETAPGAAKPAAESTQSNGVSAAPNGADRPPAGTTTGSTDMGTPLPEANQTPAPEPDWRTAADDGWQAASQAAKPGVAEVTDAGLPKRVPMAQLVPGSIDKNMANANKRSPEQVRGLLSAYHRGVQRGRTTRNGDDVKTPESTTTTGHSTHGGKEQEA
jgi:signal transduction histidine kinase